MSKLTRNDSNAQAEALKQALQGGNAPTPPVIVETGQADKATQDAAAAAPAGQPILLRATKFDIVDPTNGLRVKHGSVLTKVERITPWMAAQIKAGLVEHGKL